MMRIPASALLLASLLPALGACGGEKPAGGGNVSMRDMEVVDGTANDSMVDLDNSTVDGTPLTNAGGLPGAMPMPGTSSSNAATADTAASNSSAAAPAPKTGNSAAPE